jgi:hypothetical protein
MAFLSPIIYSVVFFLLLNWSYIKKKRKDPDYPDRPFSQLVVFPVILGLAFFLVARLFRLVSLIFLILALLLYWAFFVAKKK